MMRQIWLMADDISMMRQIWLMAGSQTLQRRQDGQTEAINVFVGKRW